MVNKFLAFIFILTIVVNSVSVSAQTDPYYATGEDLEFLSDSDNTFALEEIEYELRKFVLFRKLEDYLFNLSDQYFDSDD